MAKTDYVLCIEPKIEYVSGDSVEKATEKYLQTHPGVKIVVAAPRKACRMNGKLIKPNLHRS